MEWERMRTRVYFQESAGRFGEWLYMKEKVVFLNWNQENDCSPPETGKLGRKQVYINHLVRGLF